MKNFNAAAAQALLDMHRTEFEAYELADKEGVNRDKLLPIIKKHIQARFIYEAAALDLAEKEIKAEREQLAKEKAKADQLAEDILKMLQEDLDEDEDEMDERRRGRSNNPLMWRPSSGKCIPTHSHRKTIQR